MTWREYEDEVAEELERCYPGSTAERGVTMDGDLSGTSRQIDILLHVPDLGRIVVEVKRYGRKVHVKDVETFVGMLQDIGAARGLLVCPKGYSAAAVRRAWRGAEDVDLDVLSLDDLRGYQGFVGIPYAGSNGALVAAPFGWVLDLDTGPLDRNALAVLYRRGLTLEGAMDVLEWMYVQCWVRDDTARTVEELLEHQAAYMTGLIEGVEIEMRAPPPHPVSPTALRVARYPDGQTVEVTGFVEFEGAVFFLVLLTTPEATEMNARKVAAAVAGLRSIQIQHPPGEGGAPREAS